MSEFELGVSKDELLNIYEDATRETFNILLIDVEADKQERFRKNFKDFYTISE
jgi:hypothetical protein